MQWFSLLLILLLAAWFLLPRLTWMPVDKAARKLREGAQLIDVRTPGEYAGSQVKGARNIPLGNLREEVEQAGWNPSTPILLHCASGIRSATAARQLKGMGYEQAHNIGGFSRARKVVEMARGS